MLSYSTFEGTVPTLLVFDPDFLREAYIKNYQSFTNRRIFAMGGPSDSGILNLTGEHWKYVRSSLSPTFTQGKLKQVPVIHLIYNYEVLMCQQSAPCGCHQNEVSMYIHVHICTYLYICVHTCTYVYIHVHLVFWTLFEHDCPT